MDIRALQEDGQEDIEEACSAEPPTRHTMNEHFLSHARPVHGGSLRRRQWQSACVRISYSQLFQKELEFSGQGLVGHRWQTLPFTLVGMEKKLRNFTRHTLPESQKGVYHRTPQSQRALLEAAHGVPDTPTRCPELFQKHVGSLEIKQRENLTGEDFKGRVRRLGAGKSRAFEGVFTGGAGQGALCSSMDVWFRFGLTRRLCFLGLC